MSDITKFEVWAVKGNFRAGDEVLNFDTCQWDTIGPEMVGKPIEGIVRRPKTCNVCGARIGHEMHVDDDGLQYCGQHCPECHPKQ